jgi:hypothetical protein
LVERFVRNEEARGSNPLTSTTLILRDCRGGRGWLEPVIDFFPVTPGEGKRQRR